MSAPLPRPLRDDSGEGFGQAVHVVIDGERGPIQLFIAMLDYPLDASALRQAQARQLASFVSEATRRRYPTVVCGDFNAGPDSDEIRMLTGRSATAVEGLVFYDAWEVAGDGTAGCSFDYILSAWPRPGGTGHPVHCGLLGVRPADQLQLSDHYGVVPDLRY